MCVLIFLMCFLFLSFGLGFDIDPGGVFSLIKKPWVGRDVRGYLRMKAKLDGFSGGLFFLFLWVYTCIPLYYPLFVQHYFVFGGVRGGGISGFFLFIVFPASLHLYIFSHTHHFGCL